MKMLLLLALILAPGASSWATSISCIDDPFSTREDELWGDGGRSFIEGNLSRTDVESGQPWISHTRRFPRVIVPEIVR